MGVAVFLFGVLELGFVGVYAGWLPGWLFVAVSGGASLGLCAVGVQLARAEADRRRRPGRPGASVAKQRAKGRR